MTMWSKKTVPLKTWLVKKETAVESYEPIGYDISYVKGQGEDAQVGADSPRYFFYLVFHVLNSQLRVDMNFLPVNRTHRKRNNATKII